MAIAVLIRRLRRYVWVRYRLATLVGFHYRIKHDARANLVEDLITAVQGDFWMVLVECREKKGGEGRDGNVTRDEATEEVLFRELLRQRQRLVAEDKVELFIFTDYEFLRIFKNGLHIGFHLAAC